jgi:hypothetical protein
VRENFKSLEQQQTESNKIMGEGLRKSCRNYVVSDGNTMDNKLGKK